jgi:predicted MPP superfamily phosphohydrolase
VFRIVLIVLFAYTGVQLQLLAPNAPAMLVWGATLLLFWLMLSWQFLYRAHAEAIEQPWFHWFAWIGSACFGVWATFVMFALPIDVVGVALGAAKLAPGFMHAALPAALAAAVLVTAVGLWQTLRGPSLKFVSVRVAGLHADLEGLRIVQISDLHVGPTIRHRYVERVVRKALAAEPDIVAITGDLVDGHPERLRDELQPLARLRAPLGTYYVTGNHEYYWGGERWIEAVAALGCRPLIDRHELLKCGAATLLVAGIPDAVASSFGGANGDGIAQAAAVEADFKLLLAHRPGVCTQAAAAGFQLQLSGHTHGGQFFPFNLLVRLTHRHHRGLARVGRMWLYVSAGTGYWGPPHRFWIPAEITVLSLVRAESTDSQTGKKAALFRRSRWNGPAA